MSVLVDDAAWPWRGDRWAHLASDTSVDELHEFANAIGIRRLAFQDDHYDVPVAVRELALERGARAVTSRVLVASLRAAGLRVRGRRAPWREGSTADEALDPVLDRLHEVWPATRAAAWNTVLWRDLPAGRTAVGLSTLLDPTEPLARSVRPAALAGAAFTVARPDGVILDLVLAVPAPG